MKRYPVWLWLIALVLGWLLDFLFWRQAPGINFALYAVLCIGGGLVLLCLDGKGIARGALPLILLIGFFAAITFVRLEPLTMALAVIFVLFLMTLLASHALDGAWLRLGLFDQAAALFRLGLDLLVRPIAFNNQLRSERVEAGQVSSGSNLWPVVRGVVLAIPVLLVFAALLASADLVFGSKLNQLIQFLRLENLPEYVFRLVYILAAAYALAGVFLHASGYGWKIAPKPRTPGSAWSILGFVEATILLGGVIILFGAFVLIQFQYFFGGQANIGLQGYTYSEYARRGFGELVVVAFFSLLLIFGLSTITRRESALQRRVFSGLGVAVVALVTVMLVSAYQRLFLYEAAYGFSRLRTYTNVFLIWTGLLLIAVAVLQALGLERLFTPAALIAALGFGASLSLINVDAFIVRQNVSRALAGQALDVAYLSSLSSDSVPAVVEYYKDARYSESFHQAMGAILACRLGLDPQRSNADWRSFHLSRWAADRSMDALREDLTAYTFVNQDWPPYVVAPNGSAQYDCRGSLGG